MDWAALWRPKPIHIEETDANFTFDWKGHYRIEGFVDRKTRRTPSSGTQRRSWNGTWLLTCARFSLGTDTRHPRTRQGGAPDTWR
jgi:hypothetical protein